jgi:hypothetical protein
MVIEEAFSYSRNSWEFWASVKLDEERKWAEVVTVTRELADDWGIEQARVWAMNRLSERLADVTDGIRAYEEASR